MADRVQMRPGTTGDSPTTTESHMNVAPRIQTNPGMSEETDVQGAQRGDKVPSDSGRNQVSPQSPADSSSATTGAQPQSTQYSGPTPAQLRKEILKLNQESRNVDGQKAEVDAAISALQTLNAFEDAFVWLDQRATTGELGDLAKGSGPVAAAARYLLDHPDLLSQVTGHEGGAIKWRMRELVATLQTQSKELGAKSADLRDRAERLGVDLEEAKSKEGKDGTSSTQGTPGTPGTQGTSGTQGTPGTQGTAGTPGTQEAKDKKAAETAAETQRLVDKPLSLEMGEVKGGEPLECATQRLTNAMSGLESRIDEIVVQMGKETDPAKQKQLEAKLNQLNRLMTTVSNMLQQLMTMMQNISKMYNDIAMSGIRNIN